MVPSAAPGTGAKPADRYRRTDGFPASTLRPTRPIPRRRASASACRSSSPPVPWPRYPD